MIVMPPPAPEPIRFDVLLSQSWALFRRNWIVAVPPAVVVLIGFAGAAAFVGAIVAGLVANGAFQPNAPPPGGGFVASILAGSLVYGIVILVASLWSYAAMYGMADAAWANGTATFADGFAAFRTRAGALIVAVIGIVGLAFAAVILALPTLGLALLALPLATMYVAPAVVSGRRDGFGAIGESFRLVRRFFGTSAIALLVLLGINYGISMMASFPFYPLEFAILPKAGETVPRVPPVGLFLATGLWLVLAVTAAQAYLGYYTIAIVGLYRSLRALPEASAGLPPGQNLTV